MAIQTARNRLTQLILGKTERPRADDILLEPARVAIEDLLLVEEGVGIGERRDKRTRRVLEVENNGFRVGRFDGYDCRRGL
ncbi:MAG TPA: hypothetical protein VGK96_07380 [Candidatus Sulfotelmatobacter sp.]|jgi:hypothetical protein